jgi:hypothetical protein
MLQFVTPSIRVLRIDVCLCLFAGRIIHLPPFKVSNRTSERFTKKSVYFKQQIHEVVLWTKTS